MKNRFLVSLVGLLTVFCASRIIAQNSFGTIVGTVVDQTGAVVAHAQVEARNIATGVISRAPTQKDGNYSLVNLIPGPYAVSITQTGFRKAEAHVNLVVNQRLRVNLKLEAGSASQTVTVTANEALLDTDSSAITTFIDSHEITQLPLPSRDFMELMILSPATVYSGQGIYTDQTRFRSTLSGGSMFTGGGRESSNLYRIDGVDDNDPGFQTPTISPSIDAIQGIRLMNKNYSAQYGGSASQVNIATKSGTNKYHGTLYNFFRNDALDAVDYFSRPDPITGRIKPVLRYNQFGGSLGGPVTIPKIVNGQNHLFFFFNYEGLRSHSVVNGQARFPTSDELQGNFSGDPTIYDPSTGLPFPGNKIPKIDPKAAQIIALGLFPTPNVAPQPGFNTVAALAEPNNIDQYTARVDARIDPNDSLFVRFSSSTQNEPLPTVDPAGGLLTSQTGKNLAAIYTHIFSANIVNEFRLGLNRPVSEQTQVGAFGKNIAGSLFTGVDTAPVTFGVPEMDFTNYDTIGSNNNGPLTYTTTDAMVADNVTFVHGAHTLEFGVLGRKLYFKEVNADNPRGTVGFTGIYTAGSANPTGNAIADFLLGYAQTAEVNQGNFTGWYNSHGWDFFAQDDWKVNKRLTVNLGLRYEYESPFQEEHDRVSIFDPTYPGGRFLTPNAAAAAAVDSPLIGVTKDRNLVNPDRNNFAPRIGFAYRPLSGIVIRSGYGVFFDTDEYNEYIFPVLNPPFQKTAALTGTPADPISLDSLFPIASTPKPVPGQMSALTLAYNSRTPYVQNWNLDIEQELPGNAMAEIGYIGSEASKLHYRRQEAQGIIVNPGPNASVRFPYPNFAQIIEDTTGVSSNYNAVFGHFEKRFSKGYSFLANYTWSKVMGTLGTVGEIGSFQNYPQNSWDVRANYGALQYDVTNNFVLSGIWNLPFGRNMTYANKLPSFANQLVSGWELSGIYTARSGFPFPVTAVDESHTNSLGPLANEVGNPHSQDPVDPTRAFNRYAFAQPGPYTFGDASTDVLRGKGLSNLDLSLFKNSHVGERFNVQLRLEAFNVFNHAQIGPLPGADFSLDPSSDFGVYSTVQHEARILQLACKIIF